VLLQGEVARVEELPESTAVSSGEDLRPGFTEDESDDLKEELRNVNGLRTEVEDLFERGRVSHCIAERVRRRSDSLDRERRRSRSNRYRGSTFGKCERSSRGRLRGTCIEWRYPQQSTWWRERVSINREERRSHERKLTSMGRSFPLARISFAAT